MSLYVIGDLHLSLACEKPMDIFKGWSNYVDKIKENWNNLVTDDDTVVISGDVSWGMSLDEALKDFKFIEELPGKKLILKGNHDYWWTTVSKMEKFFQENNLKTLNILHNNSFAVDNFAVCGSRGWLFEQGEQHDIKILTREAMRISTSIKSVKDKNLEKIVFLHYPPVYNNEISEPIVQTLKDNDIKKCYYGHIHGSAQRYAIDGEYLGIDFHLISADYLKFCPVKVI
ncbi:MAG: metallophosphoesterase [Oscillospiraceae bacterium]